MPGTEQLVAAEKSPYHAGFADICMQARTKIYVLCHMLGCLHSLVPCSVCMFMLLAILHATSMMMGVEHHDLLTCAMLREHC